MLIPTKLDNLNYNPMILGAHVIRFIKKKDQTFDDTFRYITKQFNIDLELFYNVITFLWLIDIIDYSNNKIYYRGKDDPEKALY